jgi:hypothetical protein
MSNVDNFRSISSGYIFSSLKKTALRANQIVNGKKKEGMGEDGMNLNI